MTWLGGSPKPLAILYCVTSQVQSVPWDGGRGEGTLRPVPGFGRDGDFQGPGRQDLERYSAEGPKSPE